MKTLSTRETLSRRVSPFFTRLAAILLTCAMPRMAALRAGEPSLLKPCQHKHLLVDSRIVGNVQNAKLVLGLPVKAPENPLFRADKPWENALNNLYPNVLWEDREHVFKLIYYGGDHFPHTGWQRSCLPCLARLAAKVMAEMNVPVHDLYRLMINRLDLKANDFHWNDAAKRIQGDAVADFVLKLLPGKRQATLSNDAPAKQ